MAIAAGSLHNLALCSKGTVIAWGDNYFGQTNVPPALSNVIAIAAGWNHSMALKNDGTMVSWGDNSFGQTNTPLNLTNVVAIAARDNRSVALTLDLKILSLLKLGQDAALRFWSFAGRQYLVEFSPDLVNWQTTDMGSFSGNGQEIFAAETNAIANSPQRFYRIKEVTQ